jgi:hypothetical protein
MKTDERYACLSDPIFLHRYGECTLTVEESNGQWLICCPDQINAITRIRSGKGKNLPTSGGFNIEDAALGIQVYIINLIFPALAFLRSAGAFAGYADEEYPFLMTRASPSRRERRKWRSTDEASTCS